MQQMTERRREKIEIQFELKDEWIRLKAEKDQKKIFWYGARCDNRTIYILRLD